MDMVCLGNIRICINTLHKGDNDDDDDDDDDNNNNNNNNTCYVEAKCSSSDPDSNIICGSNSKVTTTKSKKT